MPIQTLHVKPGINVEFSPVLNSGGWSASNLIRFFFSLPQKIGGWVQLTAAKLIGLGRGMHGWADLTGILYLAIGTDQRLQLYSAGIINDITPIRATTNPSPAFTTSNTHTAVTVTDTANGVSQGDWVNINVPIAIDGLVIQGFYIVVSVTDANDYVINAATPATSTAGPGGTVPTYTTTNTLKTLVVTLANHGLIAGSSFTVHVTTTVGGVTLTGGTIYQVLAPVTTNTFTITQATAATSTATASENSGNAQIIYLIPSGLPSDQTLAGYGMGGYGIGTYGSPNTSIFTPMREWFLDNWGQDLIGNYNGSPIYVWIPPVAYGNVAIPINTTTYTGAVSPPSMVNSSFVAMPEQIEMAFGCDPDGGGPQDPNLVRWSDVADYTDWHATTANQAGSFRIPTGSKIVGAVQGPQFGYIWTDIDFWLIQYISPPLIFGFQKVAHGCELIAPRAAVIYEGSVYWVSNYQFFVFDGSGLHVLPCSVRDKFFDNLDTSQKDKIWAMPDRTFNEVMWFYPSLNGGGEVDSYVKFNTTENVWDYGSLVRTCGQCASVWGPPLLTDGTGLIQQHEIGYDANGSPMTATITSGYMAIAEGAQFIRVDRLIPDFVIENGGNIQITLNFIDYPNDESSPVTVGPLTWNTSTPYLIIRTRGRLVSITISSSGLGTFWRVGGFRYLGQPAGRR